MAFAEGSANDWLPLTMVDGYKVSPQTGSLIYGLFVAAMTLGRFTGGRILDRYGRVKVLSGCAVAAITGLLLVIWGQHYLIASVGVVLWGLGVSPGFPVGLSAAGDESQGAAVRVGAVATTGYFAARWGRLCWGFWENILGYCDTDCCTYWNCHRRLSVQSSQTPSNMGNFFTYMRKDYMYNMKTEKQKMLDGELYLGSDPELTRERTYARRMTRIYNQTTETDWELRAQILKELLGSTGNNWALEQYSI